MIDSNPTLVSTEDAEAGHLPSAIRPIADPRIVVTGYFSRILGLGQAARSLLDALKSAGLNVSAHQIEPGHHASLPQREEQSGGGLPLDRGPRINIAVLGADSIRHFVAMVGPRFFRGAYNIVFLFWELPALPDTWADIEDYFDEIWVGSSFTQQAIATHLRRPVLTMPLPVSVADSHTLYDRAHFGIPANKFAFLFSFDFFSYFARKNPLGLIRTFQTAFLNDATAELVIKTVNSQADPISMEELMVVACRTQNVRVLDVSLSGSEYAGLIKCCDCYASLHRSEGFGLTMAEAMALGKPVIATGWSGNLAFMTSDNSFLVRYDLRELEQDLGPYRAGCVWADPDLEHAAQLMRDVRNDPNKARLVAERGSETIRDHFSMQTVGRVVAKRLAAIMADARVRYALERGSAQHPWRTP